MAPEAFPSKKYLMRLWLWPLKTLFLPFLLLLFAIWTFSDFCRDVRSGLRDYYE